MSSYATVADLASMSMNAAAFGSVSALDQQAVLDAMSGEADGHINNQYHLPLTAYPRELTRRICDMAAYEIMCRRGYFPEGNDQILRERYDDAIKWLMLVGSGRLTPPGIVDSTPTTHDGAPVITTGVAGNVVGGNLTPSTTFAKAKPYPYTGTIPGTRGW